MADAIRHVFDASDGTYGSPKVWITLRAGCRVSVNTVARFMAELDQAGRKIRRRRGLTRPGRGGLWPRTSRAGTSPPSNRISSG
ncbi:transposase [Streptomyces misionensis]|uniref:transposase n=1 Tax=Streptomyces misionensis TaxID=67331 RepID=UPI0036F6DDBA